MLGHFNSIIAIFSNAPKRQSTELPMAANADSPNSTNDATSPKKTSLSSCSNTTPMITIGSDLPNIKMLGIYFGIYISIGTTCFYALKNHMRGHKTNDFVDALYLCVVTMTTVGYGDLVPHSFLSQLVCTAFIAVGMCLFGIVVKIAAKYLVVKQQMVLVNALHLSQKLSPMEAIKEIETLKIDYTKCIISLIAMAIHFVVGVFVLVTVEGMDFEDAVYCASTTMTTVGFGDESFSSEFGRTFGIFWIATGTSCLGQLFLYIAEVYTDIETKELVKQVLTSNIFANKSDIEAAANKVFGTAGMKDIDEVIKDVDVDQTDLSQKK